MAAMIDFLREQGVSESLIAGVERFRGQYPPPTGEGAHAVSSPRYRYYGRDVLEAAIATMLAGTHLLLAGPKATGKNVLAETLAAVFNRPEWNVSFHINMDASFMIGTDTFADGRVEFRPGPIYHAARQGGFCILDEINMARNEALAVLHSLLDFRRMLDVPGYERLSLHPATRFVATMNYGYAGTRELNEALASRFVVLHLPPVSESALAQLLTAEFPAMKPSVRAALIKMFMALAAKSESGEISSKAVDLRGLFDSLALVRAGLSLRLALDMGITNKAFDLDERVLVSDLLTLCFPDDLHPADIFEE